MTESQEDVEQYHVFVTTRDSGRATPPAVTQIRSLEEQNKNRKAPNKPNGEEFDQQPQFSRPQFGRYANMGNRQNTDTSHMYNH